MYKRSRRDESIEGLLQPFWGSDQFAREGSNGFAAAGLEFGFDRAHTGVRPLRIRAGGGVLRNELLQGWAGARCVVFDPDRQRLFNVVCELPRGLTNAVATHCGRND